MPDEIKQRHKDFVKHYDDNLKELNTDLDAIDKAKTEAEINAQIEKTKAFLEKVKSPKKHTPLDPNNLPHQMDEPVKPLRIESKISQKTQIHLAETIIKIYDIAMDILVPAAYAVEISPEEKAVNLSETIETPLSPEIMEFANELGDIPIDIFVSVRDGFKYEPYAGSVKGAVQTLREKSGNEWDLASLLITLLRGKGIPARYAVGTIQMPIDQAMGWLGVENPDMAATLLVSNGRPTSVIVNGGKITALETKHVWVQAFIPFMASRGTTTGQGDRWVDIDPSYKPQKIEEIQKIADMPVFDQDGYLSTLRSASPYEYYESQLQAFLDVASPGFKPNSFMREAEIEPQESEIIVGQLPYTVQSVDGTYSEVPDSFRQKFTLTITDPDSGQIQLNYAAVLPQIIGKKLTLSYIPASASDMAVISHYGNLYVTPTYLVILKPVIKLDGVTVVEGLPVQSGRQQSLGFLFDSTFDLGRVRNLVVAGEYYAIGLNAQANTEREHIQERIRKFQSLVGNVRMYDYTDLDDRLGELLYLTTIAYHQNLSMAIQKLTSLYKVLDVRKVSEIMIFMSLNVETIFGVPVIISPVGVVADMDRDIHLVIPVDGDVTRIKPYMQTVGNYSAYLEHAIVEKVFQTEAISAVKAIQLANDQGISLHTITKNNVATELPLLQISFQTKNDIRNAVNAGREALVPERNITLHDWIGVGYILYDPQKGSAGYMISNGYGGGMSVIVQGFLDVMDAIEMLVFGSNAEASTVKRKWCFPGKDYTWDVCYDVQTYYDLKSTDCGTVDECKKKYVPSERDGFSIPMPLIDTQEGDKDEGTYLSRTVQVGKWNCHGNGVGSLDSCGQYMRAGKSIVIFLDQFYVVFTIMDPSVQMVVTAGYRTLGRAKELRNPVKSLHSYHFDGVASDYHIRDNNGPYPKGIMLNTAYCMIGNFSDIRGEGYNAKGEANMPNSIHTATPVSRPSTDEDRRDWTGGWLCKNP
ncbi:MAG: transglutaminase family protein [Nitrospirae bacterium]|nr:transglutaminase family protein [Nitrospirota bacterium]